MDDKARMAVALEDLPELPTAVRQHGSSAHADVTGQMCFTIAVAIATSGGQ